MSEEVKKEKELPKKSELLEEQKKLWEQYNKGAEELLNKEFIVKIGTKSKMNALQKFVEHDIPSSYYKAPAVIALHTNIRMQKPYTKAPDWDGTILLNSISIRALFGGFQEWKGNGAFATKEFLELLKDVAPEIVKHIKTINECQDANNGLHIRLNEIDTILDSKEYIDDCPEVEAKSVIKEEEEEKEKLQEEVQPIVE